MVIIGLFPKLFQLRNSRKGNFRFNVIERQEANRDYLDLKRLMQLVIMELEET